MTRQPILASEVRPMKSSQLAALGIVVVLIGGVIGAKLHRPKPAPAAAAVPAPSLPGKAPAAKALPRLLELGSTTCIPCKQMAPIIDALTLELKGKVDVSFTDVEKEPAVADRYQIEVIPTQIFLDANGKELYRHTGVFEKGKLVDKMVELGMLGK
jgi:thioredoxin 1